MIRSILALIWWLSLGAPGLLGQAQVGQWRHYLPVNNPQALEYYQGKIYLATGGGALVYDLASGAYSLIGLEEGLVYPDINSLTVVDGNLWLGGAEPRGIIQVYNLETGVLDVIDLDVDQITHISATADRGFAAFRRGSEVGIIDIPREAGRFTYRDIWPNLPGRPAAINDLDLDGDTLIVTTPTAVLAGDVARGNLKDPLSWVALAGDTLGELIQYHVDSTGHWLLALNGIDNDGPPLDALWRRSPDGWQVANTFNGSTVRHLVPAPDGEFIVSFSNLLLFLSPDKGVQVSRRTQGQVMASVLADDGEGVYAIIRRNGMSRYDLLQDSWEFLGANSIVEQSYSALLKLSTGELVAAGSGGIARFNASSWYNLIPGYYPVNNPLGDRFHGNYLIEKSSFYLADTLYFRGKPSWNMLELPGGDLLVGFKGNLPEAGALLRFNYDNIPAYVKYDTTSGILDGLVGSGYTTVRHMAMDGQGNVWIALLEGKINGHALAVLQPNEQWVHFNWGTGNNGLNQSSTEIAFDSLGRVWIASEENLHASSPGGITVLDFGGTLDDKADDNWFRPTSRLASDDPNTIWSMTFDHKGILWTLAPQGLMGWVVEPGPTLRPATNFGYFLNEIPFSQGARVRVDAQNNKWISSTQDGLWVLLDNTTFWPDVDGFNVSNSPLPSNEVLDIYLDDLEGLAYIATTKGISVLRMPFRQVARDYAGLKLYPSPFHIPPNTPLIIDGLRQGSEVKIFTVSGRLVRRLAAADGTIQGYQAFWDGRNSHGEWVGSGVYLVAAFLADGRSGVSKVAVIRRQ